VGFFTQNCQRHRRPCAAQAALPAAFGPLHQRVGQLEHEVADLKSRLNQNSTTGKAAAFLRGRFPLSQGAATIAFMSFDLIPRRALGIERLHRFFADFLLLIGEDAGWLGGNSRFRPCLFVREQ
jgi:uncharacterized small protein (DUF1192 family)